MLKDIEIWRASKAIYDEEALGNKNADTGLHEYEGMRLYNNEYLTWEKWGNMVYKWHRKLLKVCISSVFFARDAGQLSGVAFARLYRPDFKPTTTCISRTQFMWPVIYCQHIQRQNPFSPN